MLTALRELPEGFRTVVYMADVKGYPYKEIADRLRIPIGTVMSRLHRGRQKLKKKLARVRAGLTSGVAGRAPRLPGQQARRD